MQCIIQGFLGAAAASVALIVTAPFSSMELPSPTPKPAIEKTVKAPAAKAPAASALTGAAASRTNVMPPTFSEKKAAQAKAKAAEKAEAGTEKG